MAIVLDINCENVIFKIFVVPESNTADSAMLIASIKDAVGPSVFVKF